MYYYIMKLPVLFSIGEDMKSRFEMRAGAKAGSTEILIYGDIGAEGLTAKSFVDALAALGGVSDLTVRINSRGGSVFDAQAMYSALKKYKAKKTVVIDGIAASAASLVAMAGDIVVMPENAMLMIHNPAAMLEGAAEAEDLRKEADALDKIKVAVIAAYRDKTGLSDAELSAIMTDETWLTAEEAVAKGFADVVGRAVEMTATHDLSRFKNAPVMKVKPALADPLAVFSMCQKAGYPELATGFVMAKAKAADIQARLQEVEVIARCCDAVGIPDEMKPLMIRGGIREEEARELIFSIKASLDDAFPHDTANCGYRSHQAAVIDHRAIYENLNKRK